MLQRTSPEAAERSLGLKHKQRSLIQKALSAQGFHPGAADGMFGTGTREAIKKWQASQEMLKTGYLDAYTAEKLLKVARVALEPFGPNWIIVENQPCQIHNPFPKPDETATWSGACVDGKGSGKGRTVWRNKNGESVYDGERRDGKHHGYGIYTSASGNRYEGMWQDGEEHGRGTLNFSDSGIRYEGEFHRGKVHGPGIMFDKSGKKVAAGNANDGCFGRQGGWWVTWGNNAEACGFK